MQVGLRDLSHSGDGLFVRVGDSEEMQIDRVDAFAFPHPSESSLVLLSLRYLDDSARIGEEDRE